MVDGPGFTAAGQLRIEAASGGGWVVLGETTGDRLADFTINIDTPFHSMMTAADIHFDL